MIAGWDQQSSFSFGDLPAGLAIAGRVNRRYCTTSFVTFHSMDKFHELNHMLGWNSGGKVSSNISRREEKRGNKVAFLAESELVRSIY